MLLLVILCALVDTLVVNGYSFKKFLNPTHFCKTVAPVVLSSLMTAANVNAVAPPPTFVPAAAAAATAANTMNRDVYFGVGCFWHVQHEFVSAERKILNRENSEISAAAGYAGSTALGKNSNNPTSKGTVCYHNLMGVADYGKLGYGEVVGLDIPKTDANIRQFAKEYFALFVKGDRPDLGDRGPEYRALLGLPGGKTSAFYPILEQEAANAGITLEAGKGSDPDTSGKKKVFVMDSNEYKFMQAEIYHQFHDGFMPNEQYPQTYNSMMNSAFKDGRIVSTGCPDINVASL